MDATPPILSSDLATRIYQAARVRIGHTIEPSLPDIFSLGTKLLALTSPEPPYPAPLIRIAIIGTATTDLLARAIAIAAIQESHLPIIQQGLFGAAIQDIIDPTSSLYRFTPDIVVILPTWRDLITNLAPDSATEILAEHHAATLGATAHYWHIIAERLPHARIIHHLPPPPPHRLTGIAERHLAASLTRQHAAMTQSLIEAGAGRVTFIDLARLAAERGLRTTASDRSWHGAKLPFDQSAIPAYVPAFRAAMRTATARIKKALILDLDNTLWGGVIGDDGVSGLKLGAGTPSGEAFTAFQSYIADLRARGVILAVCSKNDPTIAASGFTHPSTLLHRTDFAAFECAWTDKAQGLRRIAETLNIDLDSLVFADDNPVECALIRAELPQVATVELGADPAAFIDRLEAGYWFEFQSFAADDFTRNQAYQVRAAAARAQTGATDLASFLTALDMRARWFTPTGANLTRVAQLSGKTNQFNLTTSRTDVSTLQALTTKQNRLIRAVTLRDKFGDHGLIAALIATIEGTTLTIDEWIMSCRVFSRTAEHFMMTHLIGDASVRQLTRIIGTYRQTEKNAVVADLYPTLGFTADGDNRWVLEMPVETTPASFIRSET